MIIEFDELSAFIEERIAAETGCEDCAVKACETHFEYEPGGADPRLSGLSATAREAVARYGCDVDEAAFAAARIVGLYASPPNWALELAGAQRAGWKEINKWRRLEEERLVEGEYTLNAATAIEMAQRLYHSGEKQRGLATMVNTFPGMPEAVARGIIDGTVQVATDGPHLTVCDQTTL